MLTLVSVSRFDLFQDNHGQESTQLVGKTFVSSYQFVCVCVKLTDSEHVWTRSHFLLAHSVLSHNI